jgi:hypothetical protein
MGGGVFFYFFSFTKGWGIVEFRMVKEEMQTELKDSFLFFNKQPAQQPQ